MCAARHPADALARVAQHEIAGLVAERVIDEFKIVEVEQQQRKWLAPTLRICDERVHHLVQAIAVGQAGERVDVRRLPQFVARALKPDLAPDHHRLEQKYENADEARRKKIDNAMAVDISEHFVP